MHGRKVGCVYLIWAENTSLFKVGFTTDLDKRSSALKTGSPLPLKVVAAAWAQRSVEPLLHGMLKSWSAHGEWFNLPEQAVWLLLEFLKAELVDGAPKQLHA